MTILFVSDIHGEKKELHDLPAADVLILGGDLTHFGRPADVDNMLKYAEKRYPTVLAVLGNCDPPAAESVLSEHNADLHATSRSCGNVCFIGCSGSPTSPLPSSYSWDEARQEELLRTVEACPDGGTPLRILVSHAPPFGSGADSLNDGTPVGSRAIAEFARRLKPALILTGHIHEAQGVFTWEDMTVVNPGPLRDGHYALIQIAQNETPEVTLG